MSDLLILDDVGEVSEDAWAELSALPISEGGLITRMSAFEDQDGNEVIEYFTNGVMTCRIETGRPKVSILDFFEDGP